MRVAQFLVVLGMIAAASGSLLSLRFASALRSYAATFTKLPSLTSGMKHN